MSAAAKAPPGKVITFYSYKGGTGRTMLLANMAWVMASNGHRVLTVDWDLEAPGLHRYLAPFLLDPELSSTDGLIDFFTDYTARALTPNADGRPIGLDDLADLGRYSISLDWEGFGESATFDFTPAGRQGRAYSGRVNSFDWHELYGRLGGSALVDRMRARLVADYDYVLVDSRTGVSDTAGICTTQLPDTLVVCFTLNTQSIEGCAAVVESVLAQRDDIRVLPVPTRIEPGEKERLERARARAIKRFTPLMTSITPAERDRYWSDVEVGYWPFYAYEEVLATFGDSPGRFNSILGAVERLTGYATDNAVSRLSPPTPLERERVLAIATRTEVRPPSPAEAEQDERIRDLSTRLQERDQQVHELTRGTRRRAWLAAAAAGAVVLAIAIALVAALRPDSPSAPSPETSPFQLSSETLGFGEVPVGDVAEQELTITNDSDVQLHIHYVDLPDSDGFSSFGDNCFEVELDPGGSCDVAIKAFGLSGLPDDMSGVGTISYSGTEGDATLEFSLEAMLTGERSALVSEPNAVDFSVMSAGIDESATVTLTNEGSDTLQLAELIYSGREDFSIDSDQCSGAKLIAGATCEITFGFVADRSGEGPGVRLGRFQLDADGSDGTLLINLAAMVSKS